MVTAASIGALGLPAGAEAVVGCGSVITASTTLTADVADCTGDALTIGASGVTLARRSLALVLSGTDLPEQQACGGYRHQSETQERDSGFPWTVGR